MRQHVWRGVVTMPNAYGTHPVARTTDPETSHEAAASVRDIRASQKQVFDLLATLVGGATDDELIRYARRCGVMQSDSGLRTRRAELVRLGLVRDSGRRGYTALLRRSIIWEVVPRDHM